MPSIDLSAPLSFIYCTAWVDAWNGLKMTGAPAIFCAYQSTKIDVVALTSQ